jgi:hypothetical protein
MIISNSLTPTEVPLLLIGFNRIDFLKARIDEISRSTARILFLSIDGENGLSSKEMEEFTKWTRNKLKNFDKVVINQMPKNLGLVAHVTSAVSKVLSQFSHVVIVEDDIELSDKFFETILRGFQLQISKGVTGIVGGFSVLNFKSKYFKNNMWRESKYISIWGWGCSVDVWKNYKVNIDSDLIVSQLDSSTTWRKLSKFQKNVWLGRFRKIAENPSKTWDIQLQFLSFVKDFTNLYPMSTLVRNVGYSDIRSTNTKNSRPFWMSNRSPICKSVESRYAAKYITSIFNIFDRNLLFSDTKLINFWKHRLNLRFPIRH